MSARKLRCRISILRGPIWPRFKRKFRPDLKSPTHLILGAARGLLSVTDSALTAINTSLGGEYRSVVIQLADQNVTGNPRVQLSQQLYSISTSYYNYIQAATYNGTNLLSSGAANKAVIQDISANQYTIQSHDILAQGFVGARTAFPVPPGGYTPSDATALLNGGAGTHWSSLGLQAAQDFIESALNQVSADTHFIDNQITFNNALSDATTAGLGSLVDADLAKESAKLQSLQIKQQLGTQSLGIANQTPQSLLALFR